MTDDVTLDLIRAVAAKYDGSDNEADRLTESTARRLEWRKRNAGKACDVCRETKPVSEFGPDAGRPDGLSRRCRRCEAGRRREARRRNV
ncbi:head morphogenesis protein [Arthrobacter phage SWEP2]|uniref:Head morphogenesis protein n=1 Tax=Arthrobacter phage SWEP2 TaxID=2945958 RepID=A0A9E7MI88_9CAUD|nr:head morphogenesis protein [Arthrobacter phage SWEP2]